MECDMESKSIEELDKLEILRKNYIAVRHPRMKRILRIQASIGRAIREYLDGRGFIELLPPIIGPATDPGIRGARQVSFDYYGMRYKVMSSAILYKQMLVASLGKIYFFSPNIRLEPLETADTGRHLCEFVQVDLEVAHATYHDVMDVAEGLLYHVCRRVLEWHREDLEALGRTLRIPKRPFRKLTYDEALELLKENGYTVKYGEEIPWDAEEALSAMFEEPFFVYDYPMTARGFYDREDPERPGILRDFDMMYPEGYGEAVSGAEREYTVDKVLERMERMGENPEEYRWYIEMLRYGVPPSAGFGIGVERLTRYICGLRAVWEARPYPKVPGIYSP